MSSKVFGSAVDRPPAHVQRLVADHVLVVGRGGRQEPHVEVVHGAPVGAERRRRARPATGETGRSRRPSGRTPPPARAAPHRPAVASSGSMWPPKASQASALRWWLRSTASPAGDTTIAPAVRWSGKQALSRPSGCASQVGDVAVPQRLVARARRRPCRRSVARASAWSAVTPADGSSPAGGRPVEELAQPGVEVLVGERLRRRGVLAEPERVVEVGGGGQQVGVHPHAVAALGALAGPQRSPQGGGVAEPTRAQLEPDERGEGLLGRTAGRAPAAYGLLQLRGVGHPGLGGLGDDLVDPALDQRQRDLQPLEGCLLGRRLREVEEPALHRRLHRHRVGRVDARGASPRCRPC